MSVRKRFSPERLRTLASPEMTLTMSFVRSASAMHTAPLRRTATACGATTAKADAQPSSGAMRKRVRMKITHSRSHVEVEGAAVFGNYGCK